MERYEERQRERHGRLVRPVRIAAGVLLIVFGVAIGWLPGPGFVIFAMPGALLLAGEVRRAALLLDRVEDETVPRMRLLLARVRGGPKPEWVDEDPRLWGIDGDRRGDQAVDTGDRRRRSDAAATDPGQSDVRTG